MADDLYRFVTSTPRGNIPDPIEGEKPTPILDFMRSQRASQDAQVSATLSEAVKANPDRAAEAQRIAQRSGLPADLVERNFDTIAQRQRAIDLMSATALSPVLRSQLTNPNFARVAHDDTESLSTIETLMVPFRAIASAVPAFNRGVYGLSASLAGFAGATGTEQSLKVLAKRAERNTQSVAGPAGGWFGRQVQGAGRSIGLAIPGIAASVASGGTATPAVLGAYLLPGVIAEGGQSAMAASDAGLSPATQLRYAATNMAAEALFERIPAGRFINDLAAGRTLRNVLAGQIATEIPTEVATTLFQNFNQWAVINPDKPFSDFLREQPQAVVDTVVQTALGAGGTTLLGVGISNVAARIEGRGRQAEAAQSAGELLDQLTKITEASKLRERSPETFAAFVNAAAEDSAISDVFVDGRVLADALQQAPAEVQQRIGALAAVQEQLGQAVATGDSVRIPVGDFVTAFTGTGLEQSLINEIRTAPDGMTRKEAETFLQSDQATLLREEVNKVVERQVNRTEFEASLDAVKKGVLDQLATTGRFTKDVNDAYATLFANFYAVQGERIGLTPEQMAQRYPIRIQAEGVAGKRVMNQTSEAQLLAHFTSPYRSKDDAAKLARQVAGERTSNPRAIFTRAGIDARRAVRLADGTVLAATRNGANDRAVEEAKTLLGEPVQVTTLDDPRLAEGTDLWATQPVVNSDGTITIEHWGPKGLKRTDPARWGESGTLPASERSAISSSLPRTYFGIESGKPGGYIIEFPSRARYAANVPADKIYDLGSDPLGLKEAGGGVAALERRVKDAGFDGYWVGNDQLGMTATMFNPIDVREVGETGRPVADRSDFTPEGIANILERDNWAILTAENPMAQQLSDEENAARQAALKADLDALGVEYMDAIGRYAGIEKPFVVMGITEAQALELGQKHEQDSVLTRRGFLYPRSTGVEVDPAVGVTVHKTRPDDFFTEIPEAGVTFTIDIDFEARANGRLEQTGDGAGRDAAGSLAPLAGAPNVAGATGPDPALVAVAEQYARDAGIPYARQSEFVEVDPERAARIAAAYDAMEHAPSDPAVREAYQNLIEQTLAQYRALEAAGYQFYFFDETNDPYEGNPWNAMRDLRANKRMAVFATEAGFGTQEDFNPEDNPLLGDTGLVWPWGSPDGEPKRVLANDLFRAVHDAFGHGLEGAGFRARGEENAWQAHARLFTGSALAALTSETRGQNSWLNFGPYGEQNRNAAVEDTVFADQKTGLMPEWTWTEGRAGDMPSGAVLFQGGADAYTRREPATVGEATGIPLANTLAVSAQFARDNRFPNGRDFKLALQERAKAAGVDLSGFDEETAQKLADYVFEDALEAVQDNQNAIGWYDRAVTEAKQQLARLYPEILTDPESEFAFIWALAVTSNGLKVDKNFELAAKAYEAWKANGEFPTDIGIGTAAGGINDGLAMHKVLLDKLGSWQKARDFMVGEQPVKEIEKTTGIAISGEGKNEPVRGAAILGPKIGNGFFSNLYGYFDALTMDRWLMRTIGRWRGTLIERNPAMEAKKRTDIREIIDGLDRAEMKFLNGFFNGSEVKLGKRMTDAQVDALAMEVAKRSMVPEWRGRINKAPGGENLRKAGNGLANYLDGQVEAPGGAKERSFLRRAFRIGLDRLRGQPGLEALTMADLQALLWYPEKLLYETAKKPAGEEVRGYADEDAPDYANAARKLVAARLGRAGQEGDGPGAIGSGSGNQQGAAQAGTLNQGEASARGQIQFPADITKNPSVITLLQKADLSTFLHESGHFFLEVMTDMASRADAPQQVIEDMSSLLNWFGVDSLLTWKSMTLEQRREMHEKFARGFEAYLFEGKSPSVPMQGIFQRFRSWLVNVYRSMTALNVELNDEVRSVMDRMLATPEVIREAEAARNMQPLFASAEEAGMTPAEFEAYKAATVQATQDAIDQFGVHSLRDTLWLAKSAIVSRIRSDIAAKRAAVRAEVTEEVMAERVHRAREFLRRGTLNGEQVEGPHKLSLSAMRAAYPGRDEAWFKSNFGYGKYGMLAEDGIDPEQAAELFGYSSADEMVQDIATAQDTKEKIKSLTDQRVLERYGDLNSPEAVARLADEAVNNESRQQALASELGALNRMAGRARVLTSAARQFAEQTIARLRIRDIQPGRYAAAEARAGNASAEAFRKGDPALAAQEKQNQLVQSYATKAAHAAQAEVEKGMRYLRKFGRDGSRKSIDVDYLDQIDQLLERYELRAQTNKALDKRASFAAWLEAQRAMGLEPDIPPEMMAGVGVKNYREMTLEEFRGLIDTVKQIDHLGRLKKKLLTAAGKQDLDDAAADIAGSVTVNAKGDAGDLRTRSNAGGTVVSIGKQFLALHRKMASLARQMDGVRDGGAVWEYFVRSMNTAGGKEAAMRANATAELSKLIGPVLKLGKMGGKGTYYPTLGASFNREERIAIALNTGNAGNFQRLLDGEGWALEDLQPLLNDITPAEATFVQQVWDYFESYRPQIAAKERRVYGKEPDWVEPTPVELGGMELRGGYYPVKYDPRRSGKAAEHADAEEARAMLRGAYTSSTTRRSFTKQRADEVHGRPLLYSFAGIYQGTTEVIHDLAWHEWLIDVNRLLRHKSVDGAMRRYYGPEAIGVFKTAIQDIARGDAPAQNVFETAINHLRVGTTVAGLGWNLMTSLLQPLGLTQSIVRIGPQWVAKGARVWLGSPIDKVAEINEKSTFMRLRGQTMQREINEIRNQVGGQSDVRRLADMSFFMLIQKAQLVADVPTWLGAYEKAIAEGNDEARAIALSDQAVRDAQGGGQLGDLSGVQRGGPLQKLFTNFYSFFNTTYNLAAERTAATDFKKPGDVARLTLDYLMLFTVPAVLGALMRGALMGGDDGEDAEALAKRLANEQLSYLFGMMVGLREVTGGAQAALGVNQYQTAYQGPAGLRFFTEVSKLGTQINQGEFDKALRKSAVNTAGILFHLPSGQINRTWDGAEALAEGETQNPAALILGAPK